MDQGETPTGAYLRLLTPLAFLRFEKDGCQASKLSTIILYLLAMFKEPFNFIFSMFALILELTQDSKRFLGCSLLQK